MKGQLHEQPLVELIREIAAANLSGALRIERERVKVAVYFDAGEIIYAASNLRAHRLSECVLRWGLVTGQQLASVRVKDTDAQLADGLCATGALSRPALEGIIERQVSEVLRLALMWTEGVWNFDARVRLTQNVRVKLEIGKLLLESARHLPAEFIATRFPKAHEKLSSEAIDWSNLDLLPTEAFVLSRAYAPMSVHELMSISGLPEAEALQAIYVLALGNHLRRENWPQAFTAEELTQTVAAGNSTAKSGSAQPASNGAASDVKKTTHVSDAPVETKPDESVDLAALLTRLSEATDHYGVLGVRRSADAGEVKRSYHSLAKRFHPDRFHGESDKALYARVESAFTRIAQAYETLKDRQSRSEYDLKLVAQEKRKPLPVNTAPPAARAGESDKTAQTEARTQAPVHAEPQSDAPRTVSQAEAKYQEGLHALQQGDRMLAITCFGEAARLAPAQARYRAHYGRALAGNAQTRHRAEKEIQAAIKLDTSNASYRIMLAELYRDLGFPRRAQGELERALAIDPKSDAARRLLDSLEAKKK